MMSCTCSFCYLRANGWDEWWKQYRTVWRLELNAYSVEELQNLSWVWLNQGKSPSVGKIPKNMTELEKIYQKNKDGRTS